MAGTMCAALRVKLFFQAAETKQVSINRYRFIFGKIKSYFFVSELEETMIANSLQGFFKQTMNLGGRIHLQFERINKNHLEIGV